MLATVLREVYQITLYYDWRAFSAAVAGAIEVAHLGGGLGAPLIVRDGVSVEPDGTPVYYVRGRIRAERASLIDGERRGTVLAELAKGRMRATRRHRHLVFVYIDRGAPLIQNPHVNSPARDNLKLGDQGACRPQSPIQDQRH
jgi:hypothetical protein